MEISVGCGKAANRIERMRVPTDAVPLVTASYKLPIISPAVSRSISWRLRFLPSRCRLRDPYIACLRR